MLICSFGCLQVERRHEAFEKGQLQPRTSESTHTVLSHLPPLTFLLPTHLIRCHFHSSLPTRVFGSVMTRQSTTFTQTRPLNKPPSRPNSHPPRARGRASKRSSGTFGSLTKVRHRFSLFVLFPHTVTLPYCDS
jgi:hypothetical protein